MYLLHLGKKCSALLVYCDDTPLECLQIRHLLNILEFVYFVWAPGPISS